MRHEKVIKNDQEEFKIDIEAYMDTMEIRYEVDVYTKKVGARKWVPVVDKNSLAFRRLSSAEKAKTENDINTGVVTKLQILAAKMELWEKMKPEA